MSITTKMLFTGSLFVISILLTSNSFPLRIPSATHFKRNVLTLQSKLHASSNPIENETEEERKHRMEMVRQLQKSFYQDETESVKPPSRGSIIMEDVPLWRTQWTELPGFQNVLNVHVPHYTNMFQKILRSDKDSSASKYFGHLYLPGGSENLDNPEYRLEENTKASLTGVLMRITSHKEMDDGRLMIVVQALEKFRVVHAKRHHSPYSIATIELVPDDEFIEAKQRVMIKDDDTFDSNESISLSGDCKAAVVAEAFDLHKFEFQPVDDKNNEGGVDAVSPLAAYDINFNTEDEKYNALTSNSINNSILELEYKIWVHIDEMLHLLQTFVDPNRMNPVPIPNQILGLLPTHPLHPWPKKFFLGDYANKLEEEKAFIGTYTKSQFVRVDNHMIDYPPMRRVHRLSYVLWALTDTIVLPGMTDDDCFSRQKILELNSVEKRLDAGLRKLQLICTMLRNVLNQNL